MCLIQIGSGSANFDTYVQDGFSNFIRKKKLRKKYSLLRQILFT